MFIDTSVWSLALRRDQPPGHPASQLLADLLEADVDVFTTGIVLQELLQGVLGPRHREEIIRRFRHLPTLVPDIDDHIHAAEIQATCRRGGVQIKTVDALLASLCIRRELPMVTADRDFTRLARFAPLQLWPSPA